MVGMEGSHGPSGYCRNRRMSRKGLTARRRLMRRGRTKLEHHPSGLIREGMSFGANSHLRGALQPCPTTKAWSISLRLTSTSILLERERIKRKTNR